MKINFLLALFFICRFYTAVCQQPAIIPIPVQYTPAENYFTITPTTFIYCNDMTSFFDAIAFRDITLAYYELALKAGHEKYYDKNYIEVKYDSTLQLPDEGYVLTVTQEKISITGKNKGGVFYGLMTLFQLIESPTTRNFRIPCCEIKDYPRFAYRGMHLDCSRHFFDVDFIKKYIDYLALYKYNTFHWHLTDDQGWRIEIKQYPNLTKAGAWRNGSMVGHYRDQIFDTISYGGYYTQKQIQEIVKYAGKKHVTIIPEIEMPGHCLAALAAYPQYGCVADTTYETGKAWGVYPDVFCPTDETFTFLENILDEVMALFPSEYIHIGGDEVEKTRWKESVYCQQLIAEKNLKDEAGLQSYFTQRIEQYVNSKGKKIIGWDEILDVGIAPSATIMSWRGEDGGIAAAKHGYDAIMTPTDFCYFDYYQGYPENEPVAIGGYVPLEKVYNYEPVPLGLTADEAKHILGAQGNVWTEYITTPQQVEYMAIPRMLALSEVLWSPAEKKNYSDFIQRTLNHFELLDKVNCNFSEALFDVTYKVLPATGQNGVLLELNAYDFDDKYIQYSIDNSKGGSTLMMYETPLFINESTTIDFELTDRRNIFGNNFTALPIIFNKATGKKITLEKQPSKKYAADGAFTLVNGIVANTSNGWSSKDWLGFYDDDMIATIDLGKRDTVTKVTAGFLNDRLSWIYPPETIEVLFSTDGVNFISRGKIKFDTNNSSRTENTIQCTPTIARYVKVIATNYGPIPPGNPGAGRPAWLFVDEIVVE